MGIAILTLANVYQGLQHRLTHAGRARSGARRPAPWLRGLPGPVTPHGAAQHSITATTRQSDPAPICQGHAADASARSPALRVIHLSESQASARRGAGGRWVISGRMADVCAELDRLAAFEADQERQIKRTMTPH